MKKQIEIELSEKEKQQIAYDYMQKASLLDKTRMLSSLVARIDYDTIRIYKKEIEAPSKREVGEIVETFGYKIQWLQECGNHLKEYCSKNKWMTNLDYKQ
jgi:hypothetical protein